jgi:hypothetical protein
VELLEGLLRVRQQFTRGGFSTPKSRAGRRVVTFGPKTAQALEEQWNATLRRRDEDLVFGHPHLGTPLDGSKLGRYAQKALKVAGIEMADDQGRRLDFHALRHTFQTLLDRTGCSRATKKKLMRHANEDVTDGYAHAELAEMLSAAHASPDFNELLVRFAAWRAEDRRGVTRFTDGLVKLFGSELPGLGLVRNFGLLLFDLSPAAKRALSRVSWGFAGRMPRLARGLSLE